MLDEFMEELGKGIHETLDTVIINALNSGLPLEPDKPIVIMTLQEKLGRLTNPQSVDDYGLSMTGNELSSFKEGREFLNEMTQIISYQKATIYNGDHHAKRQ